MNQVFNYRKLSSFIAVFPSLSLFYHHYSFSFYHFTFRELLTAGNCEFVHRDDICCGMLAMHSKSSIIFWINYPLKCSWTCLTVVGFTWFSILCVSSWSFLSIFMVFFLTMQKLHSEWGEWKNRNVQNIRNRLLIQY